MPDVTFFIDVKPEVGLQRISGRDKIDRLDKESMSFHQRVYDGYVKLSEQYSDRIKRIDGQRDKEEVIADVIEEIKKVLKR